MDDEECLQPVLDAQEQETFKKLDSIPIVSVPLVLIIALEITGLIFVSVWPREESKCDTYFIYLYLHCVYWVIVMVVDHLIKSRHHLLRIGGYLEFYQTTYQHIRTPMFIVSLWNVVYLLLAVVLHHTHKHDYETYCRSSQWLTPINYILLLTTLEMMIIVPVYVNYIKRVKSFNRQGLPPDVTREEWLSSYAQNSFAGTGEVGCPERASKIEELLEKQADLIRYLRDHNIKLSHRLMVMAAQRNTNNLEF